MPYAGIGAKYSVGDASTKYFGGIGYLPSSKNDTGGVVGFSLGFDHKIVNQHHTIGASLGSISNKRFYGKNYTTIGIAANYSYHFSGFDNKFWVLGADLFAGKENLPDYFDRKRAIAGIALVAGYNF